MERIFGTLVQILNLCLWIAFISTIIRLGRYVGINYRLTKKGLPTVRRLRLHDFDLWLRIVAFISITLMVIWLCLKESIEQWSLHVFLISGSICFAFLSFAIIALLFKILKRYKKTGEN